MTRIALGIEYNGSRYVGWQCQNDTTLTIQQQLERALSQVADESIRVACAGRTDKGVHAMGQVVHFDTQAKRSERAWVLGCNSELPADISVQWAKEVPADFHARFSAISRRYCYLLQNSSSRPAVGHDMLAWYHSPLDVAAMQTAANCLLGEHDFTSFRASECQAKSAIRNIQHLRLQREGDTVVLDIQANGFLHHMVRNIMGSLIAVGCGKQSADWVAEVLDARDRRLAGATAKACGLYFIEAAYPSRFDLPCVIRFPHCFSSNNDENNNI